MINNAKFSTVKVKITFTLSRFSLCKFMNKFNNYLKENDILYRGLTDTLKNKIKYWYALDIILIFLRYLRHSTANQSDPKGVKFDESSIKSKNEEIYIENIH